MIDNVYHSLSDGDIHFNVYVPESYDGDSGSASLFEIGGFSAPSPKAYKLKAVEQIENDTLWLRYTAK